VNVFPHLFLAISKNYVKAIEPGSQAPLGKDFYDRASRTVLYWDREFIEQLACEQGVTCGEKEKG